MIVRHYMMTLDEHRTERGSYVDPDRYREGHRDYRPEMICHTGDGHAKGTRKWQEVTCDRCLEKLRNRIESQQLARFTYPSPTWAGPDYPPDNRAGELLTMTNGEQWFHPNNGGEPIRITDENRRGLMVAAT